MFQCTQSKPVCKNQWFRQIVKPPHRAPLLGLPDKPTARPAEKPPNRSPGQARDRVCGEYCSAVKVSTEQTSLGSKHGSWWSVQQSCSDARYKDAKYGSVFGQSLRLLQGPPL